MNKQIAYCGLACCVCSENESCVGCRNDGCKGKEWCKNYKCCREKDLNGCWECFDFPCSGGMLDKLRIRAFARFVKEYGEDELIRCLMRNKENGVVYHYDGQLVGDYDKGQTEEEIMQIIKHGINKGISHYDSLIDENNDPTRDTKPLQEYMDKWDGQAFIDELQLSPSKDALEIGVGTGRLALKVCDKCKSFTGIDISPKTIERAKDNLSEFSNKEFICGDFMVHNFASLFDIIYSSLTFMHIEDKQSAINKVAILLKAGGRFVLSISKSQDRVLDFGNRRVRLFPDNVESMNAYIKNAGLFIEKQFDTEFATIFVAVKN